VFLFIILLIIIVCVGFFFSSIREEIRFEDYLWRFEESKVLWAKGETTKAVKLAKTLIDDLAALNQNEAKSKKISHSIKFKSTPFSDRNSLSDGNEEKSSNFGDQRAINIFNADVLCLTGKWLAHTRSESSQTIHQYLKKAVSLYKDSRSKVAKGMLRYRFSLSLCMCAQSFDRLLMKNTCKIIKEMGAFIR
jgi:hypothetical protein